MLQYIILVLSNLSPVFPIYVGWKRRGVIWLYALVCLIFDINGFILKQCHIERLWASNLFFLLEFILISTYFVRNVFHGKAKQIIYWLVILTSIIYIISTIMNSVWKPNYVAAGILYGIYIVYCLYGLYEVIRQIEFTLIEKSPLFIFCIAILINASGIFIILLFENEILQINKDFIYALWQYIHNPLNILKNVLVGYVLFLSKEK